MKEINWDGSDSLLLCNPAYDSSEQESFHSILEYSQEWIGHIWLSTSGSSSKKWVGLPRKALLASAKAVNAHLMSDHNDIWIQALPYFHVGGLGIHARAFLSGAFIFNFKQECGSKWDPLTFCSYIKQKGGTLSSVVPAQLHDLLALGCEAPACLRAVLVGGGALQPELYERAIQLKWPILPSYGLTECASTVAAASLESLHNNQMPSIKLLSHIQATEKEGRICLKGDSLFSTYAFLEKNKVIFKDPKEEGWFLTEDRGMVENGEFKILGRVDALIKVGGENVDLAQLELHLQKLCMQLSAPPDAALVAIEDSRLGHVIHLACASSSGEEIQKLIERFNASVLPFERIRSCYFLPGLPRSPLGKILKNELKKLLSERFLDEKCC